MSELTNRPTLEEPATERELTCYEKALATGEPTFTLRAQDISAPIVIDQWAAMNELALGKDHPKIVGARAIANRMRLWPGRRQAD